MLHLARCLQQSLDMQQAADVMALNAYHVALSSILMDIAPPHNIDRLEITRSYTAATYNHQREELYRLLHLTDQHTILMTSMGMPQYGEALRNAEKLSQDYWKSLNVLLHEAEQEEPDIRNDLEALFPLSGDEISDILEAPIHFCHDFHLVMARQYNVPAADHHLSYRPRMLLRCLRS